MKFLFFILLLACNLIASAQFVRHWEPDKSYPLKVIDQNRLVESEPLDIVPSYNFVDLDLKDGLSSKMVNKIFIDSRNHVWVATRGGGISVYDGKAFRVINTTHGLSHDIVHDIIEDDDGRIWIATDKGISIFDGKEWEYRTYESGNFGSPIVLALMKDRKGRIWMGTSGGGFSIYFNRKAEHHIDIMGDSTVQAKCFHEDPESGDVWIGTHQKGIIHYRDGEILSKEFFVKPNHDADNIITDVQTRKEGDSTIVYATTHRGLWRLSVGGWKKVSSGPSLQVGGLTSIMVDSKDNMWIAGGYGITKWGHQDTILFNERSGLRHGHTSCLTEDIWGNIWIGFYEDALTKYLGEKFIHYSEENGLPSEIETTFRDLDDNIWFALKEGVLKYDGKKFYHYGQAEGFPNDYEVWTISQDNDGRMWFGQAQGHLVSFDGEYFKEYWKEHDYQWTRSISCMRFHENKLWIGHWRGVIYIEDDSMHYINFSSANEMVDHYHQLAMDIDHEGYLWFGSYGGGVARIDGNKSLLIKQEHGIPTDAVNSIAQDNHANYWMSMSGEGIMVLKAGAFDKKSPEWEWQRFSMLEGLPSNSISSIYVAKDGDVWISSARALTKVVLNGTDFFDKRFRLKNYTYSDGFKGIESHGKPLQDKYGKLWIQSDDHLSVFNPRLDVHTKIAPKPQITDMKIQLKEVAWDSLEGAEFDAIDQWTNLPINLSLPFEKNHIHLEFLGISFADPQGVEFSWKLNGFDEDWSPWTKQTNATYANLPWGEYSFELRCRDSFENISEPAIISFEVRKAYYHTWVFRITTAIAFILLVYFIFRWRTAALKNRQQELENTVEKRTKEIKKAKEKIEHHQTEILDSISYAKRIQEAILPPDETVKKILEESFVLYKPKDIVAGDFYWIEQVGDDTFIAAADCTGHGVPGAMVSVVCSNALNNTVLKEGITDPGKILDRVTELVVEQFKKGNDDVKDGMDICLCRWNKVKGELVFAGAHNPLWKVSKNSDELQEFKASKQPVGQFEAMVPFKSESVEVQKGDRIYLFSDGFADQFGGPKGKKLKTANFKKLICSIQNMSLSEQHFKLNSAFEDWKGDLEQLDDVCVIGVEI